MNNFSGLDDRWSSFIANFCRTSVTALKMSCEKTRNFDICQIQPDAFVLSSLNDICCCSTLIELLAANITFPFFPRVRCTCHATSELLATNRQIFWLFLLLILLLHDESEIACVVHLPYFYGI